MVRFVSVLALSAIAGTASAALVDVGVDATLTGAEGLGVSYTGAGTGFGGPVGNGSITLDSDATNLYISFNFGGGIGDNILALWLDTKSGGFTDATMNDNGDGSRRALSNLAVNADDAFDPDFLPDYGVTMGNFGNVLFELTAGPLNFLNFEGDISTPTRGYTIPLASIGVAPGGTINFMVGFISDSGYMSNESIPAYDPLQNGGNPGFGDGQFGGTIGSAGIGNYNQFTTVPAPGAAALAGIAGLCVARRRR